MVEDTLSSMSSEYVAAETSQNEDRSPDLSLEKADEAALLTVKEAAFVLGKSIRALERSLSGKWGNKLPEGWTAKRVMLEGKEEWRIVPPSGFKYDHTLDSIRAKRNEGENWLDDLSSGWHTERPLHPVRYEASPMERLWREVANAHKALAEERRAHMEDLRTLYTLQSSLRLLEVNASETAKLKTDLLEAQKDLIALRNQYREFLMLPWWKRIFRRLPG